MRGNDPESLSHATDHTALSMHGPFPRSPTKLSMHGPLPLSPIPPPKKTNVIHLTFFFYVILLLSTCETYWCLFLRLYEANSSWFPGWMSTFMSNHLSEQTKKAYLHITNTEILSLCTINMTNFFPVHVKCIVIHTANCKFSHITYCIYS